MSISVVKNNELNRFEIYFDGEPAGFVEFKVSTKRFPIPILR
jgi:hypothetical protein